MTFSYYLNKYPYRLVWQLCKWFGLLNDTVFYCGDMLDMLIFRNVQKHLKPIPVVVKNRRMQLELARQGISAQVLPVFPKAVIMCRHAAYKFPEPRITKIGMRHGAYHFKRLSKAENYNMFDLFLFSSQNEQKEAERMGIKNGQTAGLPKLDPAFDGTYDAAYIQQIRQQIGAGNKPVLLFTSTWDKSGMSAIDKWYNQLGSLTAEYCILVTTHSWVSDEYKSAIKNTPGVYWIEDSDTLPYVMCADVCIGDTSSILADCCACDKPIITFTVPDSKRTVPEIKELLTRISLQINDFQQLPAALKQSLANPLRQQDARKQANMLMFDILDGQAGKKAAQAILQLLPQLSPDENEFPH
jgi:hypothetical protein